jgi:integrase
VDGKPAAWWWSTLLYAAWCSGERIGALLEVRWQDVDLDAGLILFRAETRKGRSTDIQRAISPDLVKMLRTQAGEPEQLVWRWDRNYHSMWPSLALLCKRAGVRGTGFHKMRKASASYVALGGGDATEHLGHASPDITRAHYLDPRITSPKTALDYLPPLDLDSRDEPAA